MLTGYDFTWSTTDDIPFHYDTIKDFTDGQDKIGLIELNFDDLIITQSGLNTQISNKISGDLIAVLEGVISTQITEDDFLHLDYDLSPLEEAGGSSMVSANFRSIDDLDFSNLVGDISSDDPPDFTTKDETEDEDNSSTKDFPDSSDNGYYSPDNYRDLITQDIIDSIPVESKDDLLITFNEFK